MNTQNIPTVSPQPVERNLVASGIDDNFVFPFCVWLNSLVTNRSSDFDLIVGFLPKRLSRRNQEFVLQFSSALGVNIILKEYDSHNLFRDRRHLTSTTFLKFRISDEISTPHVWIDLDTIGLVGWDTIFDHVKMAPDSDGLVVARKLDRSTTSFNAGVLGWPRGHRRPWAPTLEELPERRFSAEQGLFNLLYGETARRIPVSFNLVSFWIEAVDPMHLPKILHFAGPSKPWHLDRKFSAQCYKYRCPWHLWYEAESDLLKKSFSGEISGRLAAYRLDSLATSLSAGQTNFLSIRIMRWLGDPSRLKLALFGIAQTFVAVTRAPVRNLHPFHRGRSGTPKE